MIGNEGFVRAGCLFFYTVRIVFDVCPSRLTFEP